MQFTDKRTCTTTTSTRDSIVVVGRLSFLSARHRLTNMTLPQVIVKTILRVQINTTKICKLIQRLQTASFTQQFPRAMIEVTSMKDLHLSSKNWR